eukprot:GHVS01007929.1.p1 GENE.GHVS01007929.1~~GHVS01007929.1.p1  ORF type:complete len:213 (+),score=64.58 GHVS01007929.1:375-1013(+)
MFVPSSFRLTTNNQIQLFHLSVISAAAAALFGRSSSFYRCCCCCIISTTQNYQKRRVTTTTTANNRTRPTTTTTATTTGAANNSARPPTTTGAANSSMRATVGEDVCWCRDVVSASVVQLNVKVRPGAKQTAIDAGSSGCSDEREVVIRVHAPARDGAANEELIAFLSSLLGVHKRHICIKTGAKSRTKVVEIAGSGLTSRQVVNILLEGVT